MKIIRPYAKLLQWEPKQIGDAFGVTNNALSRIEWCARISHRAEDKQTTDSWKRFIQSVVIDHGDWSVVEHVSVSVDAVMDRGITHEWVRHRLFSFTQESTRFVNYEKKMVPSFIYPQVDVECQYCLADPIMDHSINMCAYDRDWREAIYEAEMSYRALIAKKWRPQEARSVFPNALASRIVTTGNLRNWRHFLNMRTSQETHPQMRQLTIPLLKEFQATFPILFDDIAPGEKQSQAQTRIR